MEYPSRTCLIALICRLSEVTVDQSHNLLRAVSSNWRFDCGDIGYIVLIVVCVAISSVAIAADLGDIACEKKSVAL